MHNYLAALFLFWIGSVWFGHDWPCMYVSQLMADKEMCHLGKVFMQLGVGGQSGVNYGFFQAFLSILLQKT